MYPSIFYSNASGLYNKLDELKHCISIYKNIDIICITETHFNKNILDSEISIDGYRFFRKDKNKCVNEFSSRQNVSVAVKLYTSR